MTVDLKIFLFPKFLAFVQIPLIKKFHLLRGYMTKDIGKPSGLNLPSVTSVTELRKEWVGVLKKQMCLASQRVSSSRFVFQNLSQKSGSTYTLSLQVVAALAVAQMLIFELFCMNIKALCNLDSPIYDTRQILIVFFIFLLSDDLSLSLKHFSLHVFIDSGTNWQIFLIAFSQKEVVWGRIMRPHPAKLMVFFQRSRDNLDGKGRLSLPSQCRLL